MQGSTDRCPEKRQRQALRFRPDPADAGSSPGSNAAGDNEAAAPVETKASTEEAPAAPTSLNIYGIYKSESPYFVNEAASIEKALNDKGAEYGIEVNWQ